MDCRLPIAKVAVFFMAALPTCTAPRRTWTPPQDPTQLDDTAYLHYLATVPTVTVEEGSRAVLLLIGPTDRSATFEQRWAELEQKGAVKAAWRRSPGDTLDKGTLAYMLRVICDVPPGLNDLLAARTGLGDRRYALRTCVYHGMLSYGLPHDPVTGGELLSALSAAESRVACRVADGP
jgi:hypothetical protein